MSTTNIFDRMFIIGNKSEGYYFRMSDQTGVKAVQAEATTTSWWRKGTSVPYTCLVATAAVLVGGTFFLTQRYAPRS